MRATAPWREVRVARPRGRGRSGIGCFAAASECQLLSIAHGLRKGQLAERHRKLGLGDRFRFLWSRSDALGLIEAADMFVLSSHQEGLPVAFMEVAALGRPAVTTAVVVIADHIQDGGTGLLVSPNDPRVLADTGGSVIAKARSIVAACRGGTDQRSLVLPGQ